MMLVAFREPHQSRKDTETEQNMEIMTIPPANRFLIEGLWMMKRRRPMMKILNSLALWLTNVWTTQGGWTSLRP